MQKVRKVRSPGTHLAEALTKLNRDSVREGIVNTTSCFLTQSSTSSDRCTSSLDWIEQAAESSTTRMVVIWVSHRRAITRRAQPIRRPQSKLQTG